MVEIKMTAEIKSIEEDASIVIEKAGLRQLPLKKKVIKFLNHRKE